MFLEGPSLLDRHPPSARFMGFYQSLPSTERNIRGFLTVCGYVRVLVIKAPPKVKIWEGGRERREKREKSEGEEENKISIILQIIITRK